MRLNQQATSAAHPSQCLHNLLIKNAPAIKTSLTASTQSRALYYESLCLVIILPGSITLHCALIS